MSRFYIVAALAAMGFFSYAQHQGMSLFGGRGGQQIASGGTGGSGSGFRSGSSLSHK